MSQRFFCSEPITQAVVTLAGDEGHHLARVMRAKPGDEVVLFDGGGAEFDAQVTTVGRSSVELNILHRREVDREARVAIVLGVALPKGDRQRFLVEKAVELGIARLVPLETQRGVAQPTDAALDRLRRAVIEASKQCGRNRLLEIAPAQPIAEFFATRSEDALGLVAHPIGKPLADVLSGHGVTVKTATHVASGNPPRAVTDDDSSVGQSSVEQRPKILVGIGPEGGFTDDELHHADHAGWQAVSLGPRILRVETAALAVAASLTMHRFDPHSR